MPFILTLTTYFSYLFSIEYFFSSKPIWQRSAVGHFGKNKKNGNKSEQISLGYRRDIAGFKIGLPPL